MARLLVQLKLRLLTNALRSSRAAKVGFVVSTIFAALVAVGTFVVLAALRGQSASVDQTAAVFTVFAFGWLILPLLVFGLDGTLDPATLAMYPLRTRPLAIGLLAASVTGAWPLANLLGLLGVLVGLARGGLGMFVALLAVLLQVLFCITLARFVTTSMAGLLRSRRGKDLAAFLVIPIFALYEAFAQVVPRLAAEGKITAATFAGIDKWLRWLPPGLAAHAIQDASTGRAGTALLLLGLLAAVIVVLGGLWVRSLGRALVTVDTSTQSSARARRATPVRPLRHPRHGGRPVPDLPAPRTRLDRPLVHHRRRHARHVRQHHPDTGVPRRAHPQRDPRGRDAQHLPCQLHRHHRTWLRPGSGRPHRPAQPARLLHRSQHRAGRHRGTAARGSVLRPRGLRRASGGRVLGRGGSISVALARPWPSAASAP